MVTVVGALDLLEYKENLSRRGVKGKEREAE